MLVPKLPKLNRHRNKSGLVKSIKAFRLLTHSSHDCWLRSDVLSVLHVHLFSYVCLPYIYFSWTFITEIKVGQHACLFDMGLPASFFQARPSRLLAPTPFLLLLIYLLSLSFSLSLSLSISLSPSVSPPYLPYLHVFTHSVTSESRLYFSLFALAHTPPPVLPRRYLCPHYCSCWMTFQQGILVVRVCVNENLGLDRLFEQLQAMWGCKSQA